jgi:CheY-like chemotaxis protein
VTLESRTVLVVDDDARVRVAVAHAVALEGYPTVIATDGAEALRCLDRIDPWLVITDFQMRRMDGVELVVALRHRLPDLPAVIMTGNSEAEVLIRWIRAVYLPKPFSTDELLRAIGAATRTPHETSPQDVARVHREHASTR